MANPQFDQVKLVIFKDEIAIFITYCCIVGANNPDGSKRDTVARNLVGNFSLQVLSVNL
jgi:hypothetical protein